MAMPSQQTLWHPSATATEEAETLQQQWEEFWKWCFDP